MVSFFFLDFFRQRRGRRKRKRETCARASNTGRNTNSVDGVCEYEAFLLSVSNFVRWGGGVGLGTLP